MARVTIRSFWRDDSGAVAATYALALTALVAVAGVGFDYSRMSGLDSELQNGADQSALAGATQLDRRDGACARAGNAAVAMLNNITLLANDGAAAGTAVQLNGGTTITVANNQCGAFSGITFYQDLAKTPATGDNNANFIEVSMDTRRANHAFTPIVGAFFADMNSSAMAGIGTSICKVPPVMICNPGENTGDPNFTVGNYIGKGLKLVSVGAGGGWAPGNFGYLNTGAGSNGVPGLQEGLGWVSAPGDCLEYTGVDTKPGGNVPATDAINTRFDIYDNNACQTGGVCPASINSVKDFQRPANATGNNACRLHNSGWNLPTGYYGETAVSPSVPLSATTIPTAMGHPRDMCHLAGGVGCTGPIGNGVWDRDAYFRTNYVRGNGTRWNAAAWLANTGLPANAMRYDVYQWEIAHRNQVIDGVTVLGPQPATATGNTLRSHGQPVCSAPQGYGAGTVPGGANGDRRKFPVAVVNCVAQSVNGNSTNVQVREWIEVFLVEPSANRAQTGAGDVYVEVIGQAALAGGGSSAASQAIVRSKPYLIE